MYCLSAESAAENAMWNRDVKSPLASTYSFFSLFLSFIFKSVCVGQIVDSDSQEDVQQDVVTADEQNDEVKTEKQIKCSVNVRNLNTFGSPRFNFFPTPRLSQFQILSEIGTFLFRFWMFSNWMFTESKTWDKKQDHFIKNYYI